MQPVLLCFLSHFCQFLPIHCQFLSHVLKESFFYQNSPKMKLFLQKNAKFSSAGGSAPRPPCLWRLGALPPNPQPPAAGSVTPRPPLASGSWGLRPQIPKTAPPHCEFLALRLLRRQQYRPQHFKTIFSNSLLENTCNNTVNLEILLVYRKGS